MSQNNILILALVGFALLALIIFIIWRNQKDKKLLNPDDNDVVDEIHMDQEKRRRNNS